MQQFGNYKIPEQGPAVVGEDPAVVEAVGEVVAWTQWRWRRHGVEA
jgi:hypothetical protein